MGKAKLHWMKFYVDAWLSDEALRICSLAARGLWMHLLCLMFKNGRRGYLEQANGQPLTTEQIARSAGCSLEEAAHLLQELSSAGVSSATGTGVLYCRRMVQDADLSQKRSSAGKAGMQHRYGGAPGPGPAVVITTPQQAPNNAANRPPNNALSSNSLSGESSSPQTGEGEGMGGAGGKGVVITKPQQTPNKPDAPPAGTPAVTPEELAQQWRLLLRRPPTVHDDLAGMTAQYAELIRLGVPAAAIAADLALPGRNRTEDPWDQRKRLLDAAGLGRAARKAAAPAGDRKQRIVEAIKDAR